MEVWKNSVMCVGSHSQEAMTPDEASCPCRKHVPTLLWAHVHPFFLHPYSLLPSFSFSLFLPHTGGLQRFPLVDLKGSIMK